MRWVLGKIPETPACEPEKPHRVGCQGHESGGRSRSFSKTGTVTSHGAFQWPGPVTSFSTHVETATPPKRSDPDGGC